MTNLGLVPNVSVCMHNLFSVAVTKHLVLDNL